MIDPEEIPNLSSPDIEGKVKECPKCKTKDHPLTQFIEFEEGVNWSGEFELWRGRFYLWHSGTSRMAL